MLRTASFNLAEHHASFYLQAMQSFPRTQYFEHTRHRPDRVLIRDEWILRVVLTPERQTVQADGRIRRWCKIPEFENKALRVILLDDGVTVHNAFFDRDFTEEQP